jgi:hypothetical protein
MPRVSTRAQDHQAQMEAFATAGCREIITEAPGSRDGRPELRRVLGMLRPGDTLMIYKPDRIARSVKELLVLLEDELHARGINLHILSGICAGLHRPNGATIADKMLFMVAAMSAEMERDLIRERTLDGLRAAQAQGRRGGRPVYSLPGAAEPGRRVSVCRDPRAGARTGPRGGAVPGPDRRWTSVHDCTKTLVRVVIDERAHGRTAVSVGGLRAADAASCGGAGSRPGDQPSFW